MQIAHDLLIKYKEGKESGIVTLVTRRYDGGNNS